MRIRTKVVLSVVGGFIILGVIEAPAAGAPQRAVPVPAPTVTQTVTPEPSATPSDDTMAPTGEAPHHHARVGVSVGGRHHRIHLGL